LNQTAFDLVVSNPPYVSSDAVAGLQREVRDHEPLVALSPGGDGLSVIRRLLAEAPAFLKPNGHLIMEIGFDQGEKVQELINPEIWQLVEIRPDLQSIPRIVVVQRA
jgi:release factor glutamine methyltransferase